MTAFDSAEYISESIDSILSQSHTNLELIVVDDNSADGTYELLLEHAKRDPRVRPFKSFQNHGTYWSKNYGITKARGEFITFQDSDDLSTPDRLVVQLEPLARNEHAIASVVDYVRMDENGALLMNRGRTQRRAFPSLLLRVDPVQARVGFFDSVRTSADQEFFHRLRLVFGALGIVEIKRPLYQAFVRNDSLTTGHGGFVRLDASDDEARASLSHLSDSRRQYVLNYEHWHRRIEAGKEQPYLPFPLLERPFEAPMALGVVKGRKQEDLRRGALVASGADEGGEQAIRELAGELESLWVFVNEDSHEAPGDLGDNTRVFTASRHQPEVETETDFTFVADVEPGLAGDSSAHPAERCIVGIDRPRSADALLGSHVTHPRSGVRLAASADELDVILLSDFRFPGGTSFSNAEEIKAQAKRGLSTGLLQVTSPVLKRNHPINPAIRACVDNGLATLVPPGRASRCKLLVVRHPTVLQHAREEMPVVLAENLAVIVNQEPTDQKTGRVYYDIAECQRNAREFFGSVGTWFPIGPLVRKAVENDPDLTNLAPEDWCNIIDADDWRVSRTSYVGDKPVIGRHSRDSIDKWPDDAKKLLAAYPNDEEFLVRILGGAEGARKILGYLPENWEVAEFGSVAARDFLARIDFFVYYHHPQMVEAFGRTILEALAAGAPAILPRHFEELFEDVAIYAEPTDVRRVVRDLYSDRARYEERSRKGVAFVDERFGYAAHARRLEEMMGRSGRTPSCGFAGAQTGSTIGGADLEPDSVYKFELVLDERARGLRGLAWGVSRRSGKRVFQIPIEGSKPTFGANFFTGGDPERVDVVLSLEGEGSKHARVERLGFRRRAERPKQPLLSLGDASVTAAMATYPGRRDVVPDVIDALVAQVDKLFVYLNNYDEVPTFISRHPHKDRIVFVLDPASQRRAAAKFYWLPSIRGFHLICDDDILYPPDYAARMVDALERRQRTAIVGVHGAVFEREIRDARTSRRSVFKFPEALQTDTPVHFLGTGTVGLHSDVLAEMDLSRFQEYPIANDEVLAVSAKDAGVPMICIAREAEWMRPHSEVRFGIFEERGIDAAEHDKATSLLANANPWPDP